MEKDDSYMQLACVQYNMLDAKKAHIRPNNDIRHCVNKLKTN